MPSSRTAPAVVVAGLLTAVLWIVTGQAADWLSAGSSPALPGAVVRAVLPHPTGLVAGGEPVSGSTVLAAALAGAVVAIGTYLAVRRLPAGTGGWAVFLAVWFSVVAASVLAGSVAWFAGVTLPLPWSADTVEGFVAAALGGYWGLVNGLLVGLAVVMTRVLLDRRDDPAGTRHTRQPTTVRAWPVALTTGVTTAVLWAGVGVTRTLVTGAVDPQSTWGVARDVVLLPAAQLSIYRDELLADPVALGLPVVVGLVVATLTALAARRLPPSAGRWSLLLAVWFACVAGAVLASVVPVVVSTVTSGGVLPDVGRTLPVLEAGLAWGLVCGVLVAPLAVVVHRYAGPVRSDAGDQADEPWPAPSGASEGAAADTTAVRADRSGDIGGVRAADAEGPARDTHERDEVPANA